jgi:hypothetical protein
VNASRIDNGAGGNIGVIISFRNGGPPCKMSGYPGVAGVDAKGSQAGQADRTPSGIFGGLQGGASTPPTVDLARGDVASAVLEGLDINLTSCPLTAFVVTPPGQTTSARVPFTISLCTLHVHPVVPGPGGGQAVDCGSYAFRPQGNDLADGIDAFATTCAIARAVVQSGPDVDGATFGADYTANGFECGATPNSQSQSGILPSWAYSCSDHRGATVVFYRHA